MAEAELPPAGRKLVKKSFYLYEEQVRAIARVLYHRYLTTGKRMTESDLVREALDRYLREEDPGGGEFY